MVSQPGGKEKMSKVATSSNLTSIRNTMSKTL